MITFKELVERTYRYLETAQLRGVAPPPPREHVEDTLQRAGVMDVIRRADTLISPRRLVVHEVFIKGYKWQLGTAEDQPFEYRRQLLTGLNGWRAINSKGKSTILKVVQWAITGVKPRFKPDIESWLRRIAVQIEIIEDGVYTIEYYLEPGRPQVNVLGAIYRNHLDEVLAANQEVEIVNRFSGLADMAMKIDAFFRLRMGLASESEIFEQNYANAHDATISWNIFSQSMFIADKYNDYLFPDSRMNGKHHEETMGIHLGIDLTKAILRLKDETKLAEKEYDDEKRRIRITQEGIKQQLKKFSDELLNVEDQIHRLRQGESVRINPDYAEAIRSNRVRARERLDSLERIEDKLLEEQEDIHRHLTVARRSVKHLQESIEFELFLSGINVARCPHCENDVPETRFENELAAHRCGLCNSELKKLSGGTQLQQQEAVLEEERKRLANLEKGFNRISKDLKPVREQIGEAKLELDKFEQEYRSIAQQELEGVTPEIQRLLERQGYVNGRLDQLREQTIEFHEEKLEELKNHRDILQGALKQIQLILQQDNSELLNELLASTLEYAQLFGVTNLEAIDFDSEFLMTIKQGGQVESFRDTETSEALRIKIAFHLALLNLRFRDKEKSRHPGFLVIDAPGSGEMDDHYLGEMLTNLAKIERQFDNQVQILIASTRDEVIPLCNNDPQRVEIKLGDDPIF